MEELTIIDFSCPDCGTIWNTGEMSIEDIESDCPECGSQSITVTFMRP